MAAALDGHFYGQVEKGIPKSGSAQSHTPTKYTKQPTKRALRPQEARDTEKLKLRVIEK
jgi:hypothetical protein